MKVPLLDLKLQYLSIKDEIDAAIARVLDHCWFIMGPELKQLETELADYCQTKHAIGVASGTDALLLSLHGLGVGPGDEVVTTGFSFFATAGVISRLGAVPVFCDIEEKTFNIDPDQLELKITGKTKAIIPVHLYGQIAEMDRISEIAKKHNLSIVEDAAQAIGSRYHDRPAGTLGDAAGFSFFPSKNLGAYGDGGFIATNSDELADTLRKLRVHGAKPKYYHSIIGYNSRLDCLQASILLVKLKYLNRWHEARREKARIYNEGFNNVSGVVTPFVHDYNYHIYHQYTLIAENRDKLKEHLKEKEIGFDTYYPLPFHLQECFNDLGYRKGDLPVAERLSEKVISLPAFPELTEDQQAYVIDSVKEFYG
ncbi:MAG: DegT/DnrJ/EryC1/StrS family aminotransferase [candidate division Zixibacteria bacterium]|nr:DegT/DnrJ/EryC1/StrS family aminotransferase [candidate division Zixibacteria bacterium]